MKNTTGSNNKPAHQIRLKGLCATIWKNSTPKGPRFNTTFSRSFRKGDAWKSTDSFGRDDLLTLAFLAGESFRWIAQQPTK